MDLPKSLADFVNDLPKGSEMTVNDWFEIAGIPEEQRSDFAFEAILNQAKKRKLLRSMIF